MKRVHVVLAMAAVMMLAAGAQAAFLLEIDTDGADDGVLTYHPNFSFGGDTTSASQSSPASAPGMTGGDSIFGGNGSAEPDTYVYTYTPSVDTDNYPTALTGGSVGLYRVYATFPYSTNIHADSGDTRYTISVPTTDVVVEINQNGKGNEWVLLGDIFVSDPTAPIIVTQQPTGANMYVSMRGAGMMFEMVPEPATMLLLGAGALLLRRRR